MADASGLDGVLLASMMLCPSFFLARMPQVVFILTILKVTGITLLTKVHLVKAVVFAIVT